MPLRYLRRPLFILLVLYMLVLAVLHSRGYFDVRPQPGLMSHRYGFPGTAEGLVASPLKEDRRGQKVFIAVSRLNETPCAEKVLVYLPRDAARNGLLRPGQRVIFSGVFRPPRPARNPGDFDERGFLSDRGASMIMKAESFDWLREPVSWRWRLFNWAEAARRSIEDCFQKHFTQEEARVLSGIALGYKGPLAPDLNRAIQDAGVMHLLVPSGAKVGFVMLAALALSSFLGLGVWRRFLISGLIGGFYTLMVGSEPPYTRAYLGALALYAGLFMDRESGAFQAMTLSAVLILAVDPRALFSAGFQMTYLAMAGLVAAMPGLHRALPVQWPAWPKRLVSMAVMTTIVQLMLWPVFAGTFGRGSLVGAFANLLLVPASGLMMAGAFEVWGLSFLTRGWLLASSVWVVKWFVSLFCKVCFWFASWPWAAVDLSPMPASSVVAYYLAVSALLVWRRKASASLAAAAIAVWGASFCVGRVSAPRLSVLYLSLPESRGALVTFSGRRHWLVGPGAPAGTVLKALKAEHVARLEKIVVTSTDPRSRRALERIRREIPVGEVQNAGKETFRLCEREVCFEFDPPLARSPQREFSIIGSRLKRRAVEASTDGFNVKITNPG